MSPAMILSFVASLILQPAPPDAVTTSAARRPTSSYLADRSNDIWLTRPVCTSLQGRVLIYQTTDTDSPLDPSTHIKSTSLPYRSLTTTRTRAPFPSWDPSGGLDIYSSAHTLVLLTQDFFVTTVRSRYMDALWGSVIYCSVWVVI